MVFPYRQNFLSLPTRSLLTPHILLSAYLDDYDLPFDCSEY